MVHRRIWSNFFPMDWMLITVWRSMESMKSNCIKNDFTEMSLVMDL